MSMLFNQDLELEETLRKNIKGEVRFDKGDLSLYATDSSNYRFLPIGVVIPKDRADVIETVRICRSLGVPIVSRGGGTALAGQTTNHAVVMDMSKYFHRIIEINPEEKWARVEPGIVLDHLNRAVDEHGLIVGPDPATHSHCTIGGMLGNNSCGVHAQWAGKMEENTLELEILTYDGDIYRVGPTTRQELGDIIRKGDKKGNLYREIMRLRDRYHHAIKERFPHIPRRVSGYNLNELLKENEFNLARALVGSESTLVTILEAKIKLLEQPKTRGLIIVGYETIDAAADDILFYDGLNPIGLEGIDDVLKEQIETRHIQDKGLKELPAGNSWLMLEFGADSNEELKDLLEKNVKKIRHKTKVTDPHIHVITDTTDQKLIWKVRESGLGATARMAKEESTWEGWEDAAVDPKYLGEYLREFRALLNKYHYSGSLYGHFGQGCVHTRINFDLLTHDGIQTYHSFAKEAAMLVAKFKGSLSGEHGDGQSKAEFLSIMYGNDIIEAMNEFKKIWDPGNKMNPGKVVHPNSSIDNLRLGEHHRTHEVATHFSFAEDKGSFSYATQRCVGVGNCRQLEGQTMCPSFKVTFEEKYTTRGRAHLLFEMLKQDSLLKPWKEEAVKESLDLCLACKGCKSECPVSVDMATYKAEFLSHYYEGKLRPIAAYTMGLIFFWSRIASKIPWLVNFLTHTFPFSWLFKVIGGIAQEREIPSYAKKTFRDEFKKKETEKEKATSGKRVLVWTDSFNNYFHPQVLHSLSECLTHVGFSVSLPDKKLCCGRPLYDYGMLTLAKDMLRKVLDEMRDDIEAGTPVIFAEPSCLAVFKDELVQFFPMDRDAIRLSKQCFTLSEFLEKENIHLKLPTHEKYKFHGHCHHKALGDQEIDQHFLNQFGEGVILPTGCCGMAGSFGFEKGERFEISKKLGENDFLPTVNKEEGILIADGFSCREQVKALTGSYPLHSAEVMARALKNLEE